LLWVSAIFWLSSATSRVVIPRRARRSLSTSLGGCEFMKCSYYRKGARLGTASTARCGLISRFCCDPGARWRRLESGRVVGGDGEGAFESSTDTAESAFVKETADQRYAMRNTAGRHKFGQGMLRVWRPIRARLTDFNVASAK